MALKSGLLSESTWAVDVLAVLLRDDVTVAWFGLQHLPGLTDVLLEHLRRCLIELFPGDFDDLEVMCDSSTWSTSSRNQDTAQDWKSACNDGDLLNNCPSKSAELVYVEANSPDEELVLDDKRWDMYGDVDSSMLDWQIGRGDLTTHIQTHFSRLGLLDFTGKRFFGYAGGGRPRLSSDQTLECVDEVIRVHSNRNEHLASSHGENTTVNSSSSAEGNNSETVAENFSANLRTDTSVSSEADSSKPTEKKTDPLCSEVSGTLDCSNRDKCGSASDTNIVPSSEAGRLPPSRCKHKLCQASRASEDVDVDDDLAWLRLELKRLWCDESDVGHDDLHQDTDSSSVLCVVGDDHLDVSSRCLALSNVIRGLSFIPGNDSELARHPGLVATLSRLLLFHHQHSHPDSKPTASDLDEIVVGRPGTEVAEVLREDALVTMANVAGQLELASYPEEICVPVLDGLLHWASCRAPCALDPLPCHRDLVSAQRLALEALCKLCVTDSNVDLLLATPPFDRLVTILGNLVGAMASPDCDQVWREFAIILASSLVAGDPGVARALALHRCTLPVLVGFVEAAVADSSPSAAAGTSADMVRRATAVLRAVAELPEGRTELTRNFQSRLLQLAVSPSLDSAVLASYAHILHICSAV